MEQWLASLKGEKGDKGDPGDSGSGGGGLPGTQVTELVGISGEGVVELARSATILQVEISSSARFRLYRTEEGRSRDSGRLPGAAYNPASGAGLQYAAIGPLVDRERPAAVAWDADESTFYYRVDNGPTDVTLTWVQTGSA